MYFSSVHFRQYTPYVAAHREKIIPGHQRPKSATEFQFFNFLFFFLFKFFINIATWEQ